MEIQATSPLRGNDSEIPFGKAEPVILFRKPMEKKRSLQEIFEAEESPLLRFAFGLTKQRETAEDLVQEAFLRLHEHFEQVDQPRAWLYRAVRNLALNHLRDHRKETALEDDGEVIEHRASPERVIGKFEAVDRLRILMAELSDSDRELIGLKYHEELKYEQISERTGLSVGNVGYKLHHLLKGLADGLRRMGIESMDG
ncbi:RNA polymerase sigma factor [Luteolibacter pohnpeiensis]|uniref:RNA polymerase sigma factor n=1 Tax=Luteolibacter pohnpeiensis TaxID=454153 RepID=A0A934S953_9BACT|nr:RNA polymerase sigma factor [Luteolibacter pohnpeiensis]MBK1884432.1 RNA polymerase sigma factor [Luteolibacter pohnpeiensis]